MDRRPIPDADPANWLDAELEDFAQVGMVTALWAKRRPEAIAVIDPCGTRHTNAKINTQANRLVRLLRQHGLEPGDGLALVCSNRAEFIEVVAASLRGGFRLTPVNWHLTPDEIAYILTDSDAQALICDPRVIGMDDVARRCPGLILKLAVGGEIAGFQDYGSSLAPIDGSDISDPIHGNFMLYTSGTTGRPKGVYRPLPILQTWAQLTAKGYHPDLSRQLCAGPAYHAAPLLHDVTAAIFCGVSLYLIDKFEAELVLRKISEEKITHFHMVPLMFQRLLALPQAVRNRYPVDHVRWVIHGAAPCPPATKRAMIEWFGPVVYEYYGSTEGGGGFLISSQEWLQKPGSVGRRPSALGSRIIEEDGKDCSPNKAGKIYLQLSPSGFVYYKDQQKTERGRIDGYFTVGDIGYCDEDGYLFLTGRDAETIISGGVNIYPQEIDNVLLTHKAVEDCACVGIPHPEWGEQIKAVVVLAPGYVPSSALAADIIIFARRALSRRPGA